MIRTFQERKASDILNNHERTTYSERPASRGKYREHVMAPARLATRQAIAVGVGSGVALAAFFTLLDRQVTHALAAESYLMLWTFFIALGVVGGAWWGRATLAELIHDFEGVEIQEVTDKRTAPPLVSADMIPVNENGNTRYVQRPSNLSVPHGNGEIVLTWQQAKAIKERANEDGKITREVTGLSGRGYGDLTDALSAAGYVAEDGRGYKWTRDGLAWLGLPHSA